jgi:hypothetical protein
MNRRRIVASAVLIVGYILAGAVTFLWPGDWAVSLPLAAVCGPFLGVRMGFAGCGVIVFACVLLMGPLAIWQNV